MTQFLFFTDSCDRDNVNYIKSVKLPELKSGNRLTEIAEHLTMHDHDVTTQVIKALTDECYQLQATVRTALEIPNVLKIIWNFLDKWKGDIIMVKSLTLISNMLVAKSFLLSLRIDFDKRLLVDLLEKKIVSDISAWLKIKALDNKVKDFLLGSQSVMVDFVHLVQKGHSFIQMGDWKVTLRNGTNQKSLLNGISKMTLTEKIGTVLELVCLVSITKTYLCNFDPLKPHFYIVKLRFTGVYINFDISAKNRLWVLVVMVLFFVFFFFSVQ